MAKEPWTKIGSVLKKKDGNGTYLKVDLRRGNEAINELTLKTGMVLTIQDPRARPGITEEQLAKIPAFVKFDILLAPAREE